MELYIITFKHGNYAVATFNKLTGYGINNLKLAQTPFSIKSECDMCIKAFNREAMNAVLREGTNNYSIDNVYSAINKNGSYIYKLLQI